MVSGPGCCQSAGLRLDEPRRDSTSHLSIHHSDWAHRTAAGHLTRPGILCTQHSQHLAVCRSAGWLACCCPRRCRCRYMPREPAESDEGPRTTHWIRMLCAPFLCSGRRRSAKSRRMPGGRPAAACLRCGGQSCGRTTKSLFAAAISLPLSAPPPGGAFRGAFFCPPLAPPACPVTANQGCDVDETPSPHPNLPHPPAQNWEACDVCFCCEAPTWPTRLAYFGTANPALRRPRN